MPKAPDLQTPILDFAGIVTNADATDTEEGAAADQMNAVSIAPGELRVRQGIVPVAFEEF